MSLREISGEYKRAAIRIQQNRANNALAAMGDTLALVKTRIINRRVDEFGEAYGVYADSTWKAKQAKDSSNRSINFSETNRMWETIFPKLQTQTADYLEFVFESIDPERNDIFGYHESRFGGLIALSSDERTMLTEIYSSYLLKELP